MFSLIDLEKKLSPELLEEHRLAAITLTDAKAVELNLRNEINDVLLEGRDSGTHNFELHGMKVKAVKGLNYKLDDELIQEFLDNDELTDFEISLIRIKYEVRLADYKRAVEQGQNPIDVFDQALSVQPSLPTLAIKLGE